MHLAVLVLWLIHTLIKVWSSPNYLNLFSTSPFHTTSTSLRSTLSSFIEFWCSFLLYSLACLEYSVLSKGNLHLQQPQPFCLQQSTYFAFLLPSHHFNSLYNLVHITYALVLLQLHSKLSAQTLWSCFKNIYSLICGAYQRVNTFSLNYINGPFCIISWSSTISRYKISS